MERVNNFLTDQTTDPEQTIIPIAKGDVLLFRGIYVQCEGFFKNHRGNTCMRIGIPADALAFKRWAQRNPQKVKKLETGYFIN